MGLRETLHRKEPKAKNARRSLIAFAWSIAPRRRGNIELVTAV